MDSRLRTTSAQHLLAERRENVLEMRPLAGSARKSDQVAHEMLAAHVAAIDAELERRRAG